MAAFDKIKESIQQNDSFVLEAGAGSGKTYTLIQTINYLLAEKQTSLKLKNQKIVCITYTNVAKNEIIERLENNPLVVVSTIHEFLWECVKPYNKQLLIEFDAINTVMHEQDPDKFHANLKDRINTVDYHDRKFSDFEQGKIGHDDLITLSKGMFTNYKRLTTILADRFPYILVDEYQDTAVDTVKALIESLLEREKKRVLIGFYGDSYQKIYDTGVGSLQPFVDAGKLKLVTKEENYRSSKNVVKLLNKVRANIEQKIPADITTTEGSVRFINCNNYPPPPKKGIIEYEKSLVPQKNTNYDNIIAQLTASGWSFVEGSEDKILIIANSRVADRAGFGKLYKIYSERFGEGATEALIKRDHNLTAFFLGSVDKKTSKERDTGIEHLIAYFEAKDYTNVMRFLKRNILDNSATYLRKHEDKLIINGKIKELINLRQTGTIKQVYDYAISNNLGSVSIGLKRFLEKINTDPNTIADDEAKAKLEKDVNFYNNIMALPYKEFISAFMHTQNQTVFSTKHGTKGEEYRNVLVVIDDTSWKSNYNFQNFIVNTDSSADRLERTKNLFYVSCSRARENLVVLSLSTMAPQTMAQISTWFGPDGVTTIN